MVELQTDMDTRVQQKSIKAFNKNQLAIWNLEYRIHIILHF